MNRRNFIGSLLAASAGFSILPGAGRLWVARRKKVVWELTFSEINLGADPDRYKCVMKPVKEFDLQMTVHHVAIPVTIVENFRMRPDEFKIVS